MIFHANTCAIFCALFGLSTHTHAQQSACLSRQEIEILSSQEGIYFGELHGSREIPSLMDCITRTLAEAVKGRQQRVLFSLEIPQPALREDSQFWSGRDGRSSIAANRLISDLSKLPAEAGIDIAGHAPILGTFEDQNDYERSIAELLDKTPKDKFLIALGGNFHAAKSNIFNDSGLEPAGSRLKRKVLHVAIVNSEASTAWFCMSSICQEQPVDPSKSAGGRPPGLYASPISSFDYIYVIKKFTTSPPKEN